MALDGTKLSVAIPIPWTAGAVRCVRDNLFVHIQVPWAEIVARTQARSLTTDINIWQNWGFRRLDI